MRPRPFGFELVILSIVCIIGIFLFPASAGPYSAVHGPVTALLAVRAAARLRWAMVRAASGFVRLSLRPVLDGNRWIRNLGVPHYEFASLSCILRC